MSLSPKGLRRLADALRKLPPSDPVHFNCRCTSVDLSARWVKGSAQRMREAVNWRIARAEARKIIERMVQS